MADLHKLQTPQRNRLLASLPPDELATLLPQMQRVELVVRQVVHWPEQPITAAYFPESGWISSLQLLPDGGAAEVGHSGWEGMVGLPLLYGADTTSTETMTQASGTALRMGAKNFCEALERCPAFRTLLLRYALAFHEEVAQTAACNGRHVLEQRLARWLLMAHDRSEGDDVPMTQEFLAMMLCVQRPGVTGAIGRLQRAGHISIGRGIIKVADRGGLEETSCTCYASVRRRFETLVGSSVG
jgi:CRP-like cAMP-binding protein